MAAPKVAPAVLSPEGTAALLGIGKSTIRDLRREDPTFPVPIELSARRIGWLRAEVEAWLAARPRRAS
jgi:predicted DNA-binding transcriptional regulator AlpA